jgi:hypothetical protein
MKLCEVTEEVLENFRSNNISELGPPPNMLSWLQLALKFKQNIAMCKGEQEDDLCWLWRNQNSRRNFSIKDHSIGHVTTTVDMSLRRFAYYMFNQECDKEQLTAAYMLMTSKPKKFLHTSCGNSYCFNPDHHFESYTAYNPNRPPRSASGERSSNAKLTEQQVRDIFASKDKMIQIAAQYNVTQACVSYIKSGTTWKHLNLLNEKP